MKKSTFWDEELEIVDTTKEVLKKTTAPKSKPIIKKVSAKIGKSLPIYEKIRLVTEEVNRILGKFKDSTVVIRTRQELHDYITKAIENGVIAVDTETNNSLDAITCKIMGACLYTPGMKNAYVPINHTSYESGNLIPNQLTENDLKEEFQRILNINILFHNGKFDYKVIKCTCDIALPISWDSMICARLLDENEISASLKWQYVNKIDKSMEKYDIEHLFDGLPYSIFDPEIFALYAATDAYMTYKLYEWQVDRIKSMPDVYRLYMDVELPLIIPVAEMELRGVMFDNDYCNRLLVKYERLLKEAEQKVADELDTYKDKIAEWRKTPEANFKEKSSNGKEKKSKSEQFCEPYNLGSSTQLAIFLYDILKIPPVNKKSPRSTDKNTLPEIVDRYGINLCKYLLEKNKIDTLMSDFLIKLPKMINSKTGAVHCDLNQVGKEEKGIVTGRFSSTNPNLQQIPSKNREIRMLFKAREEYNEIESVNNSFTIPIYQEVETADGKWIFPEALVDGDKIKVVNDNGSDGIVQVVAVLINADIQEVTIECKGCSVE